MYVVAQSVNKRLCQTLISLTILSLYYHVNTAYGSSMCTVTMTVLGPYEKEGAIQWVVGVGGIGELKV